MKLKDYNPYAIRLPEKMKRDCDEGKISIGISFYRDKLTGYLLKKVTVNRGSGLYRYEFFNENNESFEDWYSRVSSDL